MEDKMVDYSKLDHANYAKFLDEIIEENKPKDLTDENAFNYHLFVEELAEASRRIKVLVEDNYKLSKLSQPLVEIGLN